MPFSQEKKEEACLKLTNLNGVPMWRTYSAAGTYLGSMFEAHQKRVTNMQNLVSSGYLVGTMLEAHKRGHQCRTCSDLGTWWELCLKLTKGGHQFRTCSHLGTWWDPCLKLTKGVTNSEPAVRVIGWEACLKLTKEGALMTNVQNLYV